MDKREKTFLGKLWHHFIRRIVAGIIVIVPVGLTIFVLRWLFFLVDGILSPFIERHIKDYFGYETTGIGFVLMIIILYLLGLFSANVLGKKIIQFFDKLFMKTPIVSFVYKIVKQLVDTISGSQSKAFKRVVLVNLLGSDMKVLGFVTGSSQGKDGGNYIHVFLPTAPNPTSGYLEFLRENQIIETNLTVEEAIKVILSGGVITPARI
jgi:uncharacterized membrane protein